MDLDNNLENTENYDVNTFKLTDVYNSVTYPTDTVSVITDLESAWGWKKLEEQINKAGRKDNIEELEAKQAKLLEQVKESAIVVHLRGVAPDVLADTLKLVRANHPWLGEYDWVLPNDATAENAQLIKQFDKYAQEVDFAILGLSVTNITQGGKSLEGPYTAKTFAELEKTFGRRFAPVLEKTTELTYKLNEKLRGVDVDFL